MIKKLLIFFCLILFLVPLVSGVKEIIVDADKAIIIKTPFIDNIPLGEDIKFQFHLFNNTDGTPITNEVNEVNCTFHLYDHKGTHIFLGNYSVFEYIYDIEVMIAHNNFSGSDTYSYIFQCTLYQDPQGTTDDLGGFVSNLFNVVDNNYIGEHNDSTGGLSIILFFGVLTIFLFWMGLTQTFVDHYVTNFIIRRGLIVVAIFSLMKTSIFLAAISKTNGLDITSQILITSVQIGWLGYFAMVVLVTGTLIQIVKYLADKKYEERMGE